MVLPKIPSLSGYILFWIYLFNFRVVTRVIVRGHVAQNVPQKHMHLAAAAKEGQEKGDV